MLADFDKGLKWCSCCRQDLPLETFGKNKAMKDGLAHYCRECQRGYSRNTSYERDPIRQKAYMKEYHRKHKYGMETSEVDDLFMAQEGDCAICHKSLKKFDIDHDHNSGAVRGLLCRSCNIALGLFQDDPDILMNAARYLVKSSLDIRELI